MGVPGVVTTSNDTVGLSYDEPDVALPGDINDIVAADVEGLPRLSSRSGVAELEASPAVCVTIGKRSIEGGSFVRDAIGKLKDVDGVVSLDGSMEESSGERAGTL